MSTICEQHKKYIMNDILRYVSMDIPSGAGAMRPGCVTLAVAGAAPTKARACADVVSSRTRERDQDALDRSVASSHARERDQDALDRSAPPRGCTVGQV